jgi:tRNA threonylcarbamoyladenosine biosynthesis protein TsaE
MTSLRSTSPEQTLQLGVTLGSALRGGEVIALHAPLGAGKTVLAKGIAQGLGITDVVTSPTYTIISEYPAPVGLVHVDLYRIESEEEYDQLAVNELVNYDTVIVIEWPERAGSYLPNEALSIEISIGPDGVRLFTLPDALVAGLSEGLPD